MPRLIRTGARVGLFSALGMGVALALTPILTRAYSPETFGEFGLLVALATSLIGMSTLRLEILGLGALDSAYPFYTRWAGLAVAATALIALGVSILAILLWDVSRNALWIGPMILLGSTQLIGSAALTREGKFSTLGTRLFAQNSGATLVQVALGTGGAVWGLVIGFLAARIPWLQYLWPPVQGHNHNGRVPVFPRRRAAQAATSAFLNSLGSQSVMISIAFFYGPLSAGLFAMTQRVFISPFQMAAQSLSIASNGIVSEHVRAGRRDLAWLEISHTVRRLAFVGIPACALAILAAPPLVPILFGAEWASVGTMIQILSLSTLAILIASPFAQLLNIVGMSHYLLYWDALRLMVFVSLFALSSLAGLGLNHALVIYACITVALYLLLLILVRRSIRPAENTRSMA